MNEIILKLRVPEYLWLLNAIIAGILYFVFLEVRSNGMAVFVISLITVILVFALFVTPFYTGIEIGKNYISMNTPPYGGKLVYIEDIQSVRKINLQEEKDFRPSIRLFGISLWKYHCGWFTLNNGRRALLLLNSDNAVLVDTIPLVIITSVQGKERLLNIKN